MKFVKVDKLPEQAHVYTPTYRVEARITEFMNMNIKIARVDYSANEYKSIKSAYQGFKKACTRYSAPADVRVINKELYLIRRDM